MRATGLLDTDRAARNGGRMPREQRWLKLNAAVWARASHATPEPEVLAESHESTRPALRALLSFKKR